MSSAASAAYTRSINRVIDYIEANLSGDLSLDRLAGVATFSRFHFHRVFAAMTGEAVHQFVLRHRLERGAHLLRREPDRTITDIALECGFATHAAFTKAFKSRYEIAPSDYRASKSKIGQADSKHWEANSSSSAYIEHRKRLQIWHGEDGQRVVKLEEESELRFAYVRHVGPFAGDAGLFQQLWKQFGSWAGPRGLMSDSARYLAVYHNDPDVTEEPMLRVSVGCTVPAETVGSGEVEVMTIAAGLYARSEQQLGPADYAPAWNWVYRDWLPISGYVPADGFAYEEFFANEDPDSPDGTHRVAICVPVTLSRR